MLFPQRYLMISLSLHTPLLHKACTALTLITDPYFIKLNQCENSEDELNGIIFDL